MKKINISLFFIVMNYANAQVAINNIYPIGIFLVDGASSASTKNTSSTPLSQQQSDDFVVLFNGNTGVGTTSPNNKLEITAPSTNTAGLKFTQINNSTPVGLGQTIGVDQNGDVVATPNPQISSLTNFNNSSGTNGANYATQYFFVNGDTWITAVNTLQTVNIPTAGKMVFVNFVLGVDIYEGFNAVGAAYPDNEDTYEAILYVDGAPSSVFQQAIVGDGDGSTQVQYNLSAFIQLAVGSHTVEIKMKRVSTSTTNPTATSRNVNFGVMSSIFNLSYLN